MGQETYVQTETSRVPADDWIYGERLIVKRDFE